MGEALIDALAQEQLVPALVQTSAQARSQDRFGSDFATKIGANVAWFSGSRANNLVIFVNQLKGARPWDDPANTGRLTFDENGYPTLVPDGYVTSQLLVRSQDVANIPPHAGAFRLYGQGNGVFSLILSSTKGAERQIRTALLPTEDIGGQTYWYVDVDFEIAKEALTQLRMRIFSVIPGDHIRDLALVHHTHLTAFRNGHVFAPEFVADLQSYDSLRFMDWMRANKIEEDGDGWSEVGSNWTSPTPEQRFVSPSYYTFNNHAGGKKNEGRFEVTVPIEHIVALANRTGADPWITLPVDTTDARAAALGRYVATHLDPSLSVFWEYGNELFNTSRGFEGYRYALKMARETFGTLPEPEGPLAVVEWAAYRGPQLYQILSEEFAAQRRKARFVAPGWAFSGSLRRNGNLNKNGYLVRYFRAAASRALQDGTPLPLDVVTDYSVAMYFGGTLTDKRPDAPVVYHIRDSVRGAEAQAQILAEWLTFGADPQVTVQLTPDQITDPAQNVVWSDALDIAATPLIWADIQAGLDPIKDLDKVLRLSGAQLQYKGVSAPEWVTVAQFDSVPPLTLQEMIDRVQLMGYGGRLFGQVFTGLRSGLALSSEWRLDAHADYAKALGLGFLAYEGGSHVSYPVEGSFQMYDAFNTGPASAEVLADWLSLMSARGVEQYMHFMSHDRTNGNDWWGVQAHIGQDVSEAPEAQVLAAARAAYDPNIQRGMTGPLRDARQVAANELGELSILPSARWAPSGSWQITPDGVAVEAEGGTKQLRLAKLLPVDGGAAYQVTLDIDLQGAPSTELRIVVRARGGSVGDVLRWQGAVTAGRLTLDIDRLAPDHRSLGIVVQRVGPDRSGTLSLAQAQLEKQGAE